MPGKKSVLFLVLILLVMAGHFALAAKEPNKRKGKKPEIRTAKKLRAADKAFGFIDSVEPFGQQTGAPKTIEFIAKATFAGEGFGETAKQHTFTLRLTVVDEDGNLICNEAAKW